MLESIQILCSIFMAIRGIFVLTQVNAIIHKKNKEIDHLIKLNEAERLMWGQSTRTDLDYTRDMIMALAECDDFRKQQMTKKITLARNTWIHILILSVIYFTSSYFLWP